MAVKQRDWNLAEIQSETITQQGLKMLFSALLKEYFV